MSVFSPKLTPRLQKIADLILPCKTLADIGTDHAYLPVYLCLENRCNTAIASDIRKGPLERAKATISKYGCTDKAFTRLGGGAETIKNGEADCIVVAGMGGLMIGEIISADREKFAAAKQIILQPMTAADELRKFLTENNWKILDEYLVKEEDKIYNIMSVASGKSEEYTPTEIYMGKKLMEKKTEHFDEYFRKRRRRLVKMIDGLKTANAADNKRIDALEKILKEMDEVLW